MTLAEFTKLTSTTLSKQGYAISKSELTEAQIEHIKKDTTVKPKVVTGYGPD